MFEFGNIDLSQLLNGGAGLPQANSGPQIKTNMAPPANFWTTPEDGSSPQFQIGAPGMQAVPHNPQPPQAPPQTPSGPPPETQPRIPPLGGQQPMPPQGGPAQMQMPPNFGVQGGGSRLPGLPGGQQQQMPQTGQTGRRPQIPQMGQANPFLAHMQGY